MSVFDEILQKLQDSGYEVQEGTIAEYIAQSPKRTDDVVCISENSCVITYGLSNGCSEAEFRGTIETWNTAPSQNQAWNKARIMRDNVIRIINQNMYDGIDVFVSDWEKNTDDLGQLHSGYKINITYTQVET